jgi:hypothetical protein
MMTLKKAFGAEVSINTAAHVHTAHNSPHRACYSSFSSTDQFKYFSTFYGTQKVHHSVHNSPQLVLTLRQINPVHTTPSYLVPSSFYPHIYVSVFLVVCFSSGFPANILYAFLFSSHSGYMPCPSQHPQLNRSTYTWQMHRGKRPKEKITLFILWVLGQDSN